jgi:molybdopterin biosynthesis enzyme
MKPGKPLWFGVRETSTRRVLVFGLPGNPVSTFVAFHLFVKPTLSALAGEPFAAQLPVACRLTGPMTHRGKRPSYQPCIICAERHAARGEQQAEGGERLAVEPLAWHSSADLATLARARGLALLPAGNYQLEAGSPVDVLVL